MRPGCSRSGGERVGFEGVGADQERRDVDAPVPIAGPVGATTVGLVTGESGLESAAEVISSGRAVLGIEFGSTRIKVALVAPDASPLASGSFSWANQLRDGIWTYDLDDVWIGLAEAYRSLWDEVHASYGVELTKLAGLGVSAMMHGYIALDAEGEPLVPFRTWRNTNTGPARTELTSLLDFMVPHRWSIAHLYQSILDRQPHVAELAHLKTLATYVHWKLTDHHVVGLNEASGMFPIDSRSGGWDERRIELFDDLVADRGFSWTLSDVLPEVLPAGVHAGALTSDGARLIDPSGRLEAGVPLCPPEGDAGTGMVATNAVRARSANVSAGTSVFAMIVLEEELSRVYEKLDIVATPDGLPVAMVHCNNGSSDLDAWVALFGEVATALGSTSSTDDLYTTLLPLALAAEPDGGGVLAVSYESGEPITGFDEGRPLVVREQGARLTLPNLMRSLSFASLCALRTGFDILTVEEGVVVEEMRGHGGFFKSGETGQRMMAAALGLPVSLPPTAGEGGAWGMAVLASYMLTERSLTLADYLEEAIGSTIGAPVEPDPVDVAGFGRYFDRHTRALAVEQAAIDSLASRDGDAT